MGPELFEQLLEVFRADNLAKNPEVFPQLFEEEERICREYREILEQGDCYNLKMLAVKGQDLKEEGVAPGKEMGEILNGMLKEVWHNPEMNDREKLLSWWKKQRKSGS